MGKQIELAEYIVERLKQAGVKQVFGVPGDYNLEFLDYFEKDPVLEWVGNANELNASYAADGYARVKGGLAVLVTTFGVGELSALNGIAGCLAERIPVLHIVGAPSTKMQKNKALLHHTLNTPGSFDTFAKMSEPLSCAQALMSHVQPDSDKTLANMFDATVKACLTQCRPAYVELPMDCVRAMVSAEGLDTPLPEPHSAPPFEKLNSMENAHPGTDAPMNKLGQNMDDHFNVPSESVTQYVVDEIAERFARAKKPAVLVDACAERFGMGPTVAKLVENCGIRYYLTPMGKGVLDERHELYGGCYAGSNSLDPVKKELESSDFVLYVGALKSDFNSGSFSVEIPTEHAVRLHSFTTNIGYASFPTTDIRHVLPRLVTAFEAVVKKQGAPKAVRDTVEQKIKEGRVSPLYTEPEGDKIVHKWLWSRMGSWLKEKDIIITETGTSSFGLLPVALPNKVTYVSQILWGSIGWSVGCLLGCALASEEQNNRRTVLFVGDGSLQLTVQEIGTMVRRGVKPYIFVLNNDGYEIERLIHGPNADYNNIQMYDHSELLKFFGGKHAEERTATYRVETQAELQKLLTDDEFAKPDRIRLIELVMPRGDAPQGLITQAKLTAKANSE